MGQKLLAPYELRRVEWVDSRGTGRHWNRVADIKADGICGMVSVGYVIHETETHICLAPHLGIEDDGDHQACGEMHIPKVSITSSNVLMEEDNYSAIVPKHGLERIKIR